MTRNPAATVGYPAIGAVPNDSTGAFCQVRCWKTMAKRKIIVTMLSGRVSAV